MSDAPRPVANELEQPYWDTARDGRLAIQRCDDCDSFTYPPRIACPVCFGELRWEEISGRGEVYTYGVVHRPSSSEYYNDHVPYVLGVVEVEEGPRILTHITGSDPAEISIGDQVTVAFERKKEFSLPVFEPL